MRYIYLTSTKCCLLKATIHYNYNSLDKGQELSNSTHLPLATDDIIRLYQTKPTFSSPLLSKTTKRLHGTAKGSPVSFLSRRNCFADIDGKAFVSQKQMQAKLSVLLTNLSALYEIYLQRQVQKHCLANGVWVTKVKCWHCGSTCIIVLVHPIV